VETPIPSDESARWRFRHGRLAAGDGNVAPGSGGRAPVRHTTGLQHEVPELSGAGQSSRRERSRREASGQSTRKCRDPIPGP
jgi:hypothetical protein